MPSTSLPERPTLSMPPPRAPSPPRQDSPPPTHRSPETRKSVIAPNTASSGKKAGFKPISAAASSSSLKRFFTGPSGEEESPPSPSQLELPSSRAESPELQTSRVVDDSPPYEPPYPTQDNGWPQRGLSPGPRRPNGRSGQRSLLTRRPRSQLQVPEIPKEKLYVVLGHVGTGTFGKVYKASHTASGRMVALKQIKMEGEREGFPVTAMREVKLLQSLRHDNVVRLYEMMVSQGESLSPHWSISCN